MSASFAVVICHGSYHTPEPYRTFIDALSDQNIKAYCPQLPSSDLSKLNIGDASNPDYDHEPPAGGYPQQAEDIVIVKELLTDLIEARNENVLLIGHSSGTVTATASATPELQQKSRAAKGKKGGVVGIFYECGFLVPPGESLHSFFQPKDGGEAVIPPFTVVHKRGFEGLLSTKEGAKYFFNDLPSDTAQRYEASLTASGLSATVLDNDAYIAMPCAYLVTENDLALPVAYQEGMIAMQSARPEVDMTVYRCPAGHSPHLSWTDGLVKAVLEFGKKALGQQG